MVVVELGVASRNNFHCLETEVAFVAFGVVAHKHLGLSIVFNDNEQSAHRHKLGVGVKHVDDLDGTRCVRTFWHIDEYAILSQHGVEGGTGVVKACNGAVMLIEHFGVTGGLE